MQRSWGATLLTSGNEQTNFQLVRRVVSGQPEQHARWDDLMIVRSGTGAVVTGDSLIGSAYRAPGERAGGHFGKSYEIAIHAGDVIRIPAAVPHAVIVSGSRRWSIC
jgi:mannose-6-phosphate isomerase-like protein (cupin superfamily)